MPGISARVLQAELAGQPVRSWLLASALALAVAAALVALRTLTLWRLAARARQTARLWDDVLVDAARRTWWATELAVGVYAGCQLLDLPPAWDQRVGMAAGLILAVQLGLWGSSVAHYVIVVWVDRREGAQDQAQKTSRNMLRFVGNLVAWSIAVLVAANQLGVSPGSLVTGLGVFGLALTLATQPILADLFASVSVLLDKPFLLGDFIVVDDVRGTVERIGIKTTRLRSLSGESIILANSDLTKSRVRNFRGMPTRRIVSTFNLHHDSPLEGLQQVSGWLREIVGAEPQARFDRAEMLAFVDAGFSFELVYYVCDADYGIYTAIAQRINFALMQRLAAHGLALGAPGRVPLPTPRGNGRPEA